MQPSIRTRGTDRFSDIAGFCFFTALAVWTIARMPTLSVWLLPTLAHEFFSAITFVIRDRAQARAPSRLARVTAYAGTFIVLLFVHAASTWKPEWLSPTASTRMAGAATVLWLLGSGIVLVSIWWLRHSFSIEPEARRVITSGPYRFARHPIYSGYVLQHVALWLNYPTAPLAVVIAAWACLMLARTRFEEQVLSETFPEYLQYKRSVGTLGPRLSLSRARAA